MSFPKRLTLLVPGLMLIAAVAACGGGSSTPPPPPTTFSISGTITGAASVTVALSGAAAASTTTDGAGHYTFASLANGAYTVTPSKAGYAFTPASRPVTLAGANQAGQDFTAALLTYTISGTITGTTGVTVALSGAATASTTIDASGNYAFTGLANGSYTVAPSKAGFTFTPLSTGVVVNGANQTGVDFVATAAANTYTVSGSVTGDRLEGISISISQGVTVIGTVNTLADGSYAFAGLVNGAYTLSASRPGYTFTPTSILVTVTGANLSGQDFVATAVHYNLSGHVGGASGVTVTLTATTAVPAPVTTDGGGNYSFSVPPGDYTITPSKAGYAFTPTSLAATVTGADVTGRDFTASVSATYVLSGTVTGAWVKGVTITLSGASTATATTDAAGAYSISGIPNDSVTVTPSLQGYAFSPAAPTVVMNGANKTQDFVASSAVGAHAISGTVSYAGAKTGRVYVTVFSTGCTNCSGMAGTSVAAPGAYTVRGLTPGDYIVMARLDSQGRGVRNASDPSGMTASPVTVGATDVTGANLTLTDPATPTPGPLLAPNLIAGKNGMLVFWDIDRDATGTEQATSYDVSWGTDVAATNLPMITGLPPLDDGSFLQGGLTDGTLYYYKVRSNVGAASGAWSPIASATAGPVAANFTVSGTVTFAGAATGPMFVAVGDPSSGNMRVAAYAAPGSSPAAFSVSGVPAGSWSVYAILDQNGNGVIDEGDLKNVNDVGAPIVVVAGNTGGVVAPLSSAAGIASTTTEHSRSSVGTDGYSLENSLYDGVKRAVKVTIVSGKNIPVPIDLARQREHYMWAGLGGTAPVVGDTYVFEVLYADGTTGTLSSSVTGLLNSFPTALTATTTGGGSVAQPLFSWAAPGTPPSGVWGYAVQLWGPGASWYYPRDAWMVDNTVTSVRYNADGNANPASLTTGTYTWSVTVRDSAGNKARQEQAYTVP